jgi:hypothetical protein
MGPAAKTVTKGAIRGSHDEIDAIDPALQDRVVRKRSSLRAFAIAAGAASEQMRAQAKGFAEQYLGPIAGALSEQSARVIALLAELLGAHEADDGSGEWLVGQRARANGGPVERYSHAPWAA